MPPKNKKAQKRQRPEEVEEDKINSKLVEETNIKKKKINTNTEACKETRQEILNVMNNEQDNRKQSNNQLLINLSQVLAQMEADYNALKAKQQKLESFIGDYTKCIKYATNLAEGKLKALKKIHSSFKEQCEQMETDHKAEIDTLADELQEDIKKLEHKLISETKRSQWEKLSKLIFHAMEKDL